MWYKIFDFNLFEEESYSYSLLKSCYGLGICNVKWLVNNGDFVNEGDVIMTCGVYYYYQHYRELTFKSPSNGYIYIKPNVKVGFECKKSMEICSIYETKEEYEHCISLFENNIFTRDYSNYVKVCTPYRLINGDDIIDYNISNSHKSSSTKIYLHPSIKDTDDLAIKITSWLCITKENAIYSCGNNEINHRNSFIYINEDYSIDVIADYISFCIKNDHSLPSFINFNEVSGDFKIYFHQTDDDTKITLKGCPSTVHGNFECSKCRLRKFENVPTYVGGDFIAKTNSISSFVGMPKYIGGCFNIANNEFDDAAWEYAKENIDGEFCDYNIANNKFVKYRKELY